MFNLSIAFRNSDLISVVKALYISFMNFASSLSLYSTSKDGWECNAGYVREQNYCMKKPPYAESTGDGWKCWHGFKKSGVNNRSRS